MTEDRFIEEMRAFIARKYKRATMAAGAWECSDNFVSLVLKGERKPSFMMLEDMGYERVESVDYKRVRK